MHAYMSLLHTHTLTVSHTQLKIIKQIFKNISKPYSIRTKNKNQPNNNKIQRLLTLDRRQGLSSDIKGKMKSSPNSGVLIGLVVEVLI